MQRVIVVGPPGSGKTTLAGAIAERLDGVHVEMDALWWERDWVEAGADTFRARAEVALGGDRWVADGNYFSNGARDTIWPMADTVVWLDLPRRTTFRRVVWRTTTRSLRRTELWNGNRETLANMFGSDALIPFAWRQHPAYRRRYEQVIHDPELAHLTWIRLRSPGDVRRWLAGIDRPPATG